MTFGEYLETKDWGVTCGIKVPNMFKQRLNGLKQHAYDFRQEEENRLTLFSFKELIETSKDVIKFEKNYVKKLHPNKWTS